MNRRLLRAALLAALAPAAAGCASVSNHAPPEWGWFDVVVRPGGAIPANLGYYGGVALWAPVGFVVGGLLPEPVDGAVRRWPAEALGVPLGLALGAPFHLVALPFGDRVPGEEEPAVVEPPPPADQRPGRE